MIASERYLRLLKEAQDYLLQQVCNCGNITCTGDSIRELTESIAAEIRLDEKAPAASSTLIIEKKPNQWVYVVSPGPLSTSGPYATQEVALIAAERQILGNGWPTKVLRKAP